MGGAGEKAVAFRASEQAAGFEIVALQKGVHQLHQIQAKQAQGFRGDVLSQRVQVGVHHAPEALRVHALERLAHLDEIGRRVSGGGRIARRIRL